MSRRTGFSQTRSKFMSGKTMKLRINEKIIFLTIISLIICNKQVYAAYTPPENSLNTANIIEQINSYINSNQTQNALNLLNKAVLNDPYNSRLFSTAADLFYKNSQYSEAEMLARKALSLNPLDNSCYLILGNVLLKNYKTNRLYNERYPTSQDLSILNESIKCFNTVSENDPASALPHIGLAKIYSAKNNRPKVYDEVLKAKELAGSDPDVLFEIGELFYECESYEKAIQYLKKSISAKPEDDYKAHILLADIYEKLGNPEEARNEYVTTLKFKNSPPETMEKLEELNSKFVPVSMVSKNTEKSPKSSEISDILQADNLLVMDRFSESRNMYLKILQKNPGNIDALSGLCELYYAQWILGHYDVKKYYLDCTYFNNIQSDKLKISLLKFRLAAEPELTESLEEELEKIANNKSADYYDRFNAVRSIFLLGNYTRAKIKLQELLTSDVTDDDKFKMAKQLYFDQNYTEADNLVKKIRKTEYDNFIKTIENRVSFMQTQGETIIEKAVELYKNKNYSDAVSKYKEELKLFPTDKKAHLYYAYALQQTGNTEKAIEEINIYRNLELIYPSRIPELNLTDIQKVTTSWQNKESERTWLKPAALQQEYGFEISYLQIYKSENRGNFKVWLCQKGKNTPHFLKRKIKSTAKFITCILKYPASKLL